MSKRSHQADGAGDHIDDKGISELFRSSVPMSSQSDDSQYSISCDNIVQNMRSPFSNPQHISCKLDGAGRTKPEMQLNVTTKGPTIAHKQKIIAKVNASKRTKLNYIRTSVASVNYPDELLTKAQMKTFKTSLMDAILEKKYLNIKPQFDGVTYKDGYFNINCLNKETLEWLVMMVPTLKLWCGAKLVVTTECPSRNMNIIAVNFAGSNKLSTDCIFNLLKAQNISLDVETWNLLRRYNKNEEAHMQIIVSDRTIAVLQEMDNLISYGIDQVEVHVKQHTKKSIKQKRTVAAMRAIV